MLRRLLKRLKSSVPTGRRPVFRAAPVLNVDPNNREQVAELMDRIYRNREAVAAVLAKQRLETTTQVVSPAYSVGEVVTF